MNTNPFWQDVLSSIKTLWKTSVFFDKNVIRETPLWFNSIFRLPLRRDWRDKLFVSDLLDYLTVPLSLSDINSKYNIKMNFLEYGKLLAILKTHFEWKEIPDSREPLPRNSFLNTILSMDTKGVANIYRVLNKKGNQIIGEVQHKWFEKIYLQFDTMEISKSFAFHNSLFKDCYLKYTQFRTLHRRFYTNEKLFKMGIKTCDKCIFCKVETDSVEHMILRCQTIANLWDRVNIWIEELGFIGYKLTERKKILGDLENGPIQTTILLLTKKVIYDSFKKGVIPSLAHIKNETKNFYYLEKYSFYLMHKSHIFDKRWHLMNIYYTNQNKQ